MGRVLRGALAVAGLLLIFGVPQAGANAIMVDTAADNTTTDAFCSLREAIMAANTNTNVDICFGAKPPNTPADDTIEFSTGSGNIALASPLPPITEPLVIDGNAGTGTAPRIELNGASAGTGADGLQIAASNSAIRNMVINRFGGDGVQITSGSGNSVTGTFIGTDTNGQSNTFGNGGDGINVTSGASNTHIGGTTGVTSGLACTGDCNLIDKNGGNGVTANGGGTTIIEGNVIGQANRTDMAFVPFALPNTGDGIHVTAPGYTIGGATPEARNVISGNTSDGIEVASTADHGSISGNYIGLDTAGAVDLGNAARGIFINAPFTTVGGNVVSGNDMDGVFMNGPGAHDTVVAGNIVGLDAAGTDTRQNSDDGVQTENSTDNTIGGDTAAERNVISGNGESGVDINNTGSARNVVSGNYIGTDITGTVARTNHPSGIELTGQNNRVGGTTGVSAGGACTGECNLLSGNIVGVDVVGTASTSGTTILGNYIGTTANGSTALGNSQYGALIGDTTTGTTVGGTAAGAGNVIGANGFADIRITEPTSGNSVLGNTIGLTSSGGPLNNGAPGVLIDQFNGGKPTNNTIGGDTAAAENVISNHTSAAIRVNDDETDGNLIARNRGSNNSQFIDIGPPLGPGTDAATGANGGVQPPVITGAGATAAKGIAAAGSTVRLFRTTTAPGSEITGVTGFAGSATADGSGHWVLNYQTAPGAGETVTASQTTVLGSSELSTAFAPESIPPDTGIVSGPADGSATADNTPTFGFESEPNATFECRVDDGSFAPCPNPDTLDALSDGEHTLRVRAVDTNLNPDPVPASRTFTVDASVPDTEITSRPPAVGRGATVTTAFSSSEVNTRFECKLDGGAFTQCLSPDTRPVSEGNHVFQVRAVDAVGNVDATPASTSFRIDRTRPVASKFGLRKSTVKVGRSGNAFRFKLTEASRVVITIEQKTGRKFVRRGRLVRGASRAGQNSVTFKGKLGSKKLKPGSYRASLVATDLAENASRVRRIAFRVAR